MGLCGRADDIQRDDLHMSIAKLFEGEYGGVVSFREFRVCQRQYEWAEWAWVSFEMGEKCTVMAGHIRAHAYEE